MALLIVNKLRSNVETATHFTGMVKMNNQGDALFEISIEGEFRLKTEY
jgi:hypothetical protein